MLMAKVMAILTIVLSVIALASSRGLILLAQYGEINGIGFIAIFLSWLLLILGAAAALLNKKWGPVVCLIGAILGLVVYVLGWGLHFPIYIYPLFAVILVLGWIVAVVRNMVQRPAEKGS